MCTYVFRKHDPVDHSVHRRLSRRKVEVPLEISLQLVQRVATEASQLSRRPLVGLKYLTTMPSKEEIENE